MGKDDNKGINDYCIILKGYSDNELVKAKLTEIYAVTPEDAEQIISCLPIIIQDGLSFNDAKQKALFLEEAGAIINITNSPEIKDISYRVYFPEVTKPHLPQPIDPSNESIRNVMRISPGETGCPSYWKTNFAFCEVSSEIALIMERWIKSGSDMEYRAWPEIRSLADGSVRWRGPNLRDIGLGKSEHAFETSLATSPDGKCVVIVGHGVDVICNTSSNTTITSMAQHGLGLQDWSCSNLAFSPDGRLLVAAGRSDWKKKDTIAGYSTDSWERLSEFFQGRPETTKWVGAMAFRPHSSHLAVAFKNGEVWLVDIVSGIVLWRWMTAHPPGDVRGGCVNYGQNNEPCKIAFSPSGKQLSVGYVGGQIDILDLESSSPLVVTTLSRHQEDSAWAGKVSAIGWVEQPNWFVSAGSWPLVRAWDATTWRPVGIAVSQPELNGDTHIAVAKSGVLVEVGALKVENSDGYLKDSDEVDWCIRVWNLAVCKDYLPGVAPLQSQKKPDKCRRCYYYMGGERTLLTPAGTGTCSLGKRQPFTVTPGERLKVVCAHDLACTDFEDSGTF